MEVKITNLADDFIKFWEIAKDKSLDEKKVLWKSEYEEKHREIFEHFVWLFRLWEKTYNIEDELDKNFQIYEKVYNNIVDLKDIDKQIKNLCEKCSKEFNVSDINLSFVVMVGLNRANAFATPFNNGTVFYFLEKIGEPKYVEMLLIHEITHLFHRAQIKENNFHYTVAYSILAEGLAVFNSEYLCPGFRPSEYICSTYGMDYWIEQCNSILKELKPILLDELGKSDEYIKKYFYGDNLIKDGIPTRIGYWIGYNVVKDLNNTYALPEIILWDAERIEKEVKSSIERII